MPNWPGTYHDFYEAKDVPNAIQAWADRAVADYRARTFHDGFNLQLPSIISSFQPKSGGTFIFNRLLALGYTEHWWGIVEKDNHRRVYAVPIALRLHVAGGCAAHTHFLPTPHNIRALDAAGVQRIWVHVRDPVAATVSAYYHYLGLGQGTGAVASSRQAANEAERVARGVRIDGGLSAFVSANLSVMTRWVEEWFAYAELRPRGIILTSYAELSSPESMLARVLADVGRSDIAVPPLPARLADDRYRTGTLPWREELDADTVDSCESVLTGLAHRWPQQAYLLA